MSNTNDALLEEKLLKIFRLDNDELLKNFIMNNLHANRPVALSFFQKMISTLQGKMRFKVLEILMQDASKDIVPLMIAAIRQEKNVLFAKSILFLYGNFEHSEALIALLKVESKIHFDMMKSFQKVSAKLKARFREIFYITEFEQGEKNAKRMLHAAEMMIKEPDEAYPPFLATILENGVLSLRKSACKVLTHIGDKPALEMLSKMLPTYFEDRNKTRDFGSFMTSEKTHNKPKLTDIVSTFAILGKWNEEESSAVEQSMRSGNIMPAIDIIRKTLMPEKTLITEDIIRFVEDFLCRKLSKKQDIKRITRLFAEHYESQSGLLQDVMVALGNIGCRSNSPDLLEGLEKMIPIGTRDEQELIASFLGGYQSPASMKKLLELLTPGQKPELVGRVLSALECYELTELPIQLTRVAKNTSDGLQRQTALNLIARSNLLPSILEELLENPSAIVVFDTIQTIAAYKVEEGYQMLLKTLSPDLNTRMQEAVIKALEVFPRDETGKAVSPFLLLPFSYLVRFAALQTLLLAGGTNRIAIILECLEQYTEKQKPEMVGSFLKLVSENWQPDLLKYLSFWRDLFCLEFYENLRPQALILLEHLDWDQVACEKWIEMLQAILKEPKVKRTSQENKTIRIFILKAKASSMRNEPGPAPPKKEVSLETMIDKIEDCNLQEKVRAFRMLNLHFKPAWYTEGDPQSTRLVKMLRAVFEDNLGLPELTKGALTLAGRLQNPELLELLKQKVPEFDPDLAHFAKAALKPANEGAAQGHPLRKVMVLDDTVLVAKVLQRFLVKSGFEAIAETTPEAALATLKNNQYDLLILDVLMPGMDGFEFIEETRRLQIAPASIIMITSSRDPKLLKRARLFNLQGFLLKPFPVHNLLEKIQNLRALPPGAH